MGYYSFYRIIKDIIKTIFNSKVWRYFLICVIICLVLAHIFPKGVFAFDDTIVVSFTNSRNTTSTYNLPKWLDNYYWIFYVYKADNYCGFLVSSTPITVTSINTAWHKYNVNCDDYYQYASSLFNDGSNSRIQNFINSFTESTYLNNKTSGSGSVQLPTGNSVTTSVFFSNHTVENTSGTIIIPETNPKITEPEIATPQEDLENLSFDYISVNANSWSDKIIYALFYDRNNMTSESTEGLYPIKEIPLSKEFYSDYLNEELSTDNNSVFWIPNNATGLYFVRNGNYEIRLAERIYSEDGGGGFRDENENYSYSYFGNTITFSVSDAVSDDRLNLLNNATKELQEKQRHDETIGAINKQTDQDKNFYDGILSNEYNQNQAGDTLTGMGGGFRDSVDDSSYVGLFSTVVSKFASIINGDYSSVDRIEYPLPNSDKKIIITSDILYNIIKDTFVYNYLQLFWTYLFGMYIFKFSYGLIKAIKTGSILDGYSWENEVITSSML